MSRQNNYTILMTETRRFFVLLVWRGKFRDSLKVQLERIFEYEQEPIREAYFVSELNVSKRRVQKLIKDLIAKMDTTVNLIYRQTELLNTINKTAQTPSETLFYFDGEKEACDKLLKYLEIENANHV